MYFSIDTDIKTMTRKQGLHEECSIKQVVLGNGDDVTGQSTSRPGPHQDCCLLQITGFQIGGP